MKKIFFILISLLLCTGCQDHPVTKPISVGKNYNYFYHHLQTNQEKRCYQSVYQAFLLEDAECTIDKDDLENSDQLETIVQQVLQDHPEIFWVNGYSYQEEDDDYKVKAKLLIKKEEIPGYKKQLKSIVKEYKNEVNKYATLYEKLQYTYNYVLQHCIYQENAPYNQEIISSMIEGKTVCSGYAKMYQYLCQNIGIDCTYIYGQTLSNEKVGSGLHAWNMVKYNKDYYYIDPTWGDTIEGIQDYAYFMMTSQDTDKLYKASCQKEETKSNKDSYFHKSNLYLDQVNIDQLVPMINADQSVLQVQCDEKIYNSLKTKLIQQNQIFELLKKRNIYRRHIQYYEEKNINVLTITW